MRHIQDIDKINQLLHYLKGAEIFSIVFTDITRSRSKWCPFQHGDKIDNDCYRANPKIQELLEWVYKYIMCCKFLDVNRYTVDNMYNIYSQLKNPESIQYYEEFCQLLKMLKGNINYVENDVSAKLARLSCQECIRLDESLVCFENYSFYASVIMSVSSVENRIIEMIKRANKRLYSSTFSKFTLGQLIQIFDEHKYKDRKFHKIKLLMPQKHKPLVNLLNQYRVFSAHPKEEQITAQIAESILHLSFAFMIDETTCPYEKKELVCK